MIDDMTHKKRKREESMFEGEEKYIRAKMCTKPDTWAAGDLQFNCLPAHVCPLRQRPEKGKYTSVSWPYHQARFFYFLQK